MVFSLPVLRRVDAFSCVVLSFWSLRSSSLRRSATSGSWFVRTSLHFGKEVVSECIQTGLQRIGRPSRNTAMSISSVAAQCDTPVSCKISSPEVSSFWADRAKSHLICSLSERKTTKSDSAWMRGMPTLFSTSRRVLSWSPPKDVNLEYVEGARVDGDSWIIPQEVGEEAVSEVVLQALLLRDGRRPMVLSLDRDEADAPSRLFETRTPPFHVPSRAQESLVRVT